MKKIGFFLILFFVLFFVRNTIAQEVGAPFIKNYTPLDYNGVPQVWCGIRDSAGQFYIGNAEYIIRFNGTAWNKIPIGKNKTVRSVAKSKSGRIFLGTLGDFGYLDKDSIGNTTYISLLNYLDSADRNFTNVWSIVTDDNAVYFVSEEALFRFPLKNEEIDTNYRAWIPRHREFVFGYNVSGQVYIYKRGKGLFSFENDSLIPLEGAMQTAKLFIWRMFSYGNSKMLLATHKGLFIYDKSKKGEDIVNLEDFDPDLITKTNDLIQKSKLYSAAQINDSTYALGTIKNGIIIVNNKGKVLRIINKEIGLPNNTVHHLYYDESGILWASTAYGVSKIELSVPVSFWNERLGLKGSIYNVYRSKKGLFASSNLSVYYLKDNKFYEIKGLDKGLQCFDLIDVQDAYEPDKSGLIVAVNGAVYEIKEMTAKPIANYTTYGFIPSNDPSMVYFFSYNSLYSLQLKGRRYEVNNIAEFSGYAYAAAPTIAGKIWVIVDGQPLLLSEKEPYKPYEKKSYFADSISFKDVQLFDKKNYFIADSAIYELNERTGKFEKSRIFDGLVEKNKLQISSIQWINKDTSVIAYTKSGNERVALIRKKDNEFYLDSLVFLRLPQVGVIRTDGDDYLWNITVNELYKIDLKKKLSVGELGKVLIDKIKLGSDSLIASEFLSGKNLLVFDYENNDLIFEYSLPYFINEEANQYSYRLKGDKKRNKWSDWSAETKKELSNLHEGDYVFMVKARNVFGFETEPTEYHFTILPPWYRTVWAYIAYLILAIVFVWLLIKWNTRRLIKEKERLEQIVKERTAEIEQQKEEIQAQAENLKEANTLLEERNEEINQQKEEIQAILDNLQEAYESISYMNAELARANEDIKKTNQKITDSILYAKRIQFAVLPPEPFLEKNFSEHFIFFKPKDIVSGDFYWFREINNYLLIAVADGTGHGVPGAFISMMGATYLNEITSRTDLTKASDVLNILRDEIATMLHTDDDIESRDGMDIAFCVLNKETLELQYSGAHHPLYLFRNGDFTIIQGDRMPIGVSRRKKEFTNHHIQLQKGDTLYMFSDGFADQFGGEDGRKYLVKRFKQLLQLIHRESMEHQKEVLENEFYSWKGKFDQVDDILIIGLRI